MHSPYRTPALPRLWQLAAALGTVTLILTTHISATEAKDRRICLLDVQILGTGAGIICEGDEGATAVIDTSCQAFEPIRYSRTDSAETIRQAREHNAAFDALCKKDRPDGDQ